MKMRGVRDRDAHARGDCAATDRAECRARGDERQIGVEIGVECAGAGGWARLAGRRAQSGEVRERAHAWMRIMCGERTPSSNGRGLKQGLDDSRRSRLADIDAILAIQSASPEIAQWTLWDYDRVARGEMAGWVAEESGEVVGFLVGRQVVSDLEILNFAVRARCAATRSGQGASCASARVGQVVRAPRMRFWKFVHPIYAALQFYERHDFRADRHGARAITRRPWKMRSF